MATCPHVCKLLGIHGPQNPGLKLDTKRYSNEVKASSVECICQDPNKK